MLTAIGLRRVILAGISMGGYVALRMWARNPELIAALVLSNTKAERDSDEIVARRRSQIANIQQHGLAEFILTRRAAPLSPETLERRPWVLDSITMMNFTVSAEANTATLEAMAVKPDDTATLATIDVPTLITSGSDDIFIPKNCGRRAEQGIRASRLRVTRTRVTSAASRTRLNTTASSTISWRRCRLPPGDARGPYLFITSSPFISRGEF